MMPIGHALYVHSQPQIDDWKRLESRSQDLVGRPSCKGPQWRLHGLDVKDATKQEAVLNRRQSVVVGEAEAVVFLRRPKSYRGLGRCSEVGSTHFQEKVGVVVPLSILRALKKAMDSCEVKVRPIFLT